MPCFHGIFISTIYRPWKVGVQTEIVSKMKRLVALFLVLSAFSANAEAQCQPGDGIQCIRAEAWQWIGSGDFFLAENWLFGPLFGGPSAVPNLDVSFGPIEIFENGVSTGFDPGSSDEATLVGDFTSSGFLVMRTGVDTTLSISSGTYTLLFATIGELAPEGFGSTSGTATVNLDNACISGPVVVGSNGMGRLTSSGTSCIVGPLTLAQGSGSTGSLEIVGGSFDTSSFQFGSGTANISNAGSLVPAAWPLV